MANTPIILKRKPQAASEDPLKRTPSHLKR
jgi:hypothetical protein